MHRLIMGWFFNLNNMNTHSLSEGIPRRNIEFGMLLKQDKPLEA